MKKQIVALTILISLLFGAATSAAAETYTVKSGDTLWSISKKYNVKVQSIQSWNRLSSNLIVPGQKLAVKGGTFNKASSNSAPKTRVASQSVKEFKVQATAYTAYCSGCSGITATGMNLRANPKLKVIAVDPKVIPLGSRVWVEGYGEAIAADKGSAIKGNKIDVFIPTQQGALNWGRKTVTIKIIN